MSNRSIFRLAVVGLLVLELGISTTLYFFDDESLDQAWELLPETVDWFNFFDVNSTILIVVGLLLLFTTVASFIGVLLFRNWGRWLYLGSTILIFPVSIFTGPTIYFGWESALWDIVNMANGAIILSMFLPPINNEFSKLS